MDTTRARAEQWRHRGGGMGQTILPGASTEHATRGILGLPASARWPGQVEVMPKDAPNSEWI